MLKHILDPLTKCRRRERVYLWYTNKKEKKTFPVLCIAYYGSEWVQPCPVGHGRTTCQIIGWLVYVWCRRWPEIERGILRRGSAGRRGIQRASSGAVGRHSALAPGGRRNDRRIGEALLFSFTGDPLDSNNEREGIEKAGQAERSEPLLPCTFPHCTAAAAIRGELLLRGGVVVVVVLRRRRVRQTTDRPPDRPVVCRWAWASFSFCGRSAGSPPWQRARSNGQQPCMRLRSAAHQLRSLGGSMRNRSNPWTDAARDVTDARASRARARAGVAGCVLCARVACVWRHDKLVLLAQRQQRPVRLALASSVLSG